MGLNLSVKRNRDGIGQVMKQLQQQLDAQQKELAAFQEKYKIRLGQPGVDDDEGGQGAAAANGKKQGGGGSSGSSSKQGGDKDSKKSRGGVLI